MKVVARTDRQYKRPPLAPPAAHPPSSPCARPPLALAAPPLPRPRPRGLRSHDARRPPEQPNLGRERLARRPVPGLPPQLALAQVQVGPERAELARVVVAQLRSGTREEHVLGGEERAPRRDDEAAPEEGRVDALGGHVHLLAELVARDVGGERRARGARVGAHDCRDGARGARDARADVGARGRGRARRVEGAGEERGDERAERAQAAQDEDRGRLRDEGGREDGRALRRRREGRVGERGEGVGVERGGARDDRGDVGVARGDVEGPQVRVVGRLLRDGEDVPLERERVELREKEGARSASGSRR